MNRAICTVTSWSHIGQSLAMAESASRCFSDVAVHIFSTDKPKRSDKISSLPQNVHLHFMDEQPLATAAGPFLKKYRKEPDFLRWSLKPVLISYVLTELESTSVFFADNDLYFFENCDHLFTELEQNRFLLCPHWRIKDPTINKDWFDVNFTDGLYNGGFVGATIKGIEILDWWAKACLFACEINFGKGRRGAQKYLDLLPAEFEGVSIIRHRGCNVAFWNQHENRRELVNGKVLINGLWPILFIHFTGKLEKDILSGKDGNLKSYLEDYRKACEKAI